MADGADASGVEAIEYVPAVPDVSSAAATGSDGHTAGTDEAGGEDDVQPLSVQKGRTEWWRGTGAAGPRSNKAPRHLDPRAQP